MARDYKIIGKRIKNARLNKNLTQEKLAEMLNISIAYLSRVETGTTKINLKRLDEICKILEISDTEILSGTSDTSINYLNSDLGNIFNNCSPEKQRLIYEIANIISNSELK